MLQGIAYAIVAGLPPQFGLYASIMGAFGYVVFGSTKVLLYIGIEEGYS